MTDNDQHLDDTINPHATYLHIVDDNLKEAAESGTIALDEYHGLHRGLARTRSLEVTLTKVQGYHLSSTA